MKVDVLFHEASSHILPDVHNGFGDYLKENVPQLIEQRGALRGGGKGPHYQLKK